MTPCRPCHPLQETRRYSLNSNANSKLQYIVYISFNVPYLPPGPLFWTDPSCLIPCLSLLVLQFIILQYWNAALPSLHKDNHELFLGLPCTEDIRANSLRALELHQTDPWNSQYHGGSFLSFFFFMVATPDMSSALHTDSTS